MLSRVETTIDDRVVDGDRVWTRATSKGINRETGERSIVTWLLVQRIEGGRIAEHWVATFTGVDWTRLSGRRLAGTRSGELDADELAAVLAPLERERRRSPPARRRPSPPTSPPA